jgi:hypothetical protein
LKFPTAIALDVSNNRVLVLDITLDALVAIDLDSGNRTIISDDDTGTGTNLSNPAAIVLDSTNNRSLVLDNILDALVVIDLTTGERAIASR